MKFELKCIRTMPGPGQLCKFIENVLCFRNIGGMASFFVNIKGRVCFGNRCSVLFNTVSVSKDRMNFDFISRNKEKADLYNEFFFYVIAVVVKLICLFRIFIEGLLFTTPKFVDQGTVSRRSRKVFGPRKPQQKS